MLWYCNGKVDVLPILHKRRRAEPNLKIAFKNREYQVDENKERNQIAFKYGIL